MEHHIVELTYSVFFIIITQVMPVKIPLGDFCKERFRCKYWQVLEMNAIGSFLMLVSRMPRRT